MKNNFTCFCFVTLSRNPLNCVCIMLKTLEQWRKVLLSHIETRNEYFLRLYFVKNCFIFIFVILLVSNSLIKPFQVIICNIFFLCVIFYFRKKVFEMYISRIFFFIWNIQPFLGSQTLRCNFFVWLNLYLKRLFLW